MQHGGPVSVNQFGVGRADLFIHPSNCFILLAVGTDKRRSSPLRWSLQLSPAAAAANASAVRQTARASAPTISPNPRVTIACITVIENNTRRPARDLLRIFWCRHIFRPEYDTAEWNVLTLITTPVARGKIRSPFIC